MRSVGQSSNGGVEYPAEGKLMAAEKKVKDGIVGDDGVQKITFQMFQGRIAEKDAEIEELKAGRAPIIDALDEMVRDCMGMNNRAACTQCPEYENCEPTKVLARAQA